MYKSNEVLNIKYIYLLIYLLQYYYVTILDCQTLLSRKILLNCNN